MLLKKTIFDAGWMWKKTLRQVFLIHLPCMSKTEIPKYTVCGQNLYNMIKTNEYLNQDWCILLKLSSNFTALFNLL